MFRFIKKVFVEGISMISMIHMQNVFLMLLTLIWRPNETRYIKWHETCKCKCRLDSSVCNKKQWCTEDKGRCGCKELIDKGICNKEFNWDPCNCECECDKSCDAGEDVDYENYQCRKRLSNKLVEESLKILMGRNYIQIAWFTTVL